MTTDEKIEKLLEETTHLRDSAVALADSIRMQGVHIESLHQTAEELTDQMRRAQENDRLRRAENARLQRGIMLAIQAYLDATTTEQ